MPKTKGKKKKNVDNTLDANITVGSKQLLASVEEKTRREKYVALFNELLEVICETNQSAHNFAGSGKKEVPTLLVGYITRAMGLNLTNEQVLNVVEMIEDKDAASRGYVPAAPLKEVVVETLISGMLVRPKGSTPLRKGAGDLDLHDTAPVSVVRDSEERIYQAFRVLDIAKRGYLEVEEMRHFLRSGGEPFTEEELEEFIAAAADPESGRIYYEDFADVLANE